MGFEKKSVTERSLVSKKILSTFIIMALDITNAVDIIELMENYVERIRPPHHLRNKVDISYRIDNQSIILFELRPHFQIPGKIVESEYGKATYVKSEDKWKVYWKGGNMKWKAYAPYPEVKHLKGFIELVEADTHGCFKG
jgi:hypothetical protein